MKKIRKAFTLIELLVVIAIIAILATIIIINVMNARKKAVDTKALSDLSTAQRNAAICLTEEEDLNYDSNTPPSNPAQVCCAVYNFGAGDCTTPSTKVTDAWPIMPVGGSYGSWQYMTSALNNFSSGYGYFPATNSFGFGAFTGDDPNTAPNKTVQCTQTGCTKSW